MKVAVVAPEDLALGFKLAGAEVVVPEDPRKTLASLAEREDLALVVVDASLRSSIDQRLYSRLLENTRPVFLFVPLSGSPTDPRRRIEELTAQTLGYTIRVR